LSQSHVFRRPLLAKHARLTSRDVARTVYAGNDAIRGDAFKRRILENNHEVTLADRGSVAT
jgi:hypothetical protein